MKVINQSIEIMDNINPDELLNKLELAGRVCYKSEDLIKEGSRERFLKSIISRGHESVLEHSSITVRAITSRGVSHQLVRHRLASYSQESQRYVNYSKDKFGNEITFIQPEFTKNNEELFKLWEFGCSRSEIVYFKLLNEGAKPEYAREVLPNSTKTEIVMTHNIRSWRHFLKLRTDKASHPEIRILSNLILDKFMGILPVLFEDIK